ncbi:hypothetical protein CDL12_12401 [Handroanthus impetiginosus]|uniref:Uncharacterized protein n=1 Tax=Handroanthus impetiginosus TaxID=429701 RepID=A0A2G9HBN3_9LAMI|nr:hypothetical protein CDL12_12401 [Handroanthus impetiginosus]
MANSHRGLYRVKTMRMVLILQNKILHKSSSLTDFTNPMTKSFWVFSCDCGKDDPETNNEMKKDIVAIYTEEISLHENVTSESLQRTKALIMGAKRTSSHYQKEAEKCNARMETYEEARERAEVALIEERKLTTLWMSRAREYGWKDNISDCP